MRRQILEREHVAGGKADDSVGIDGTGEFAEGAQDREQIFGGAVVGNDDDEGRSGGAAAIRG